MPVFHTKTIESILEPVATQVSRLVILHEEAEDDGKMPDLTQPVEAVSRAVENLIRVGNETIDFSQDQILKQDMPPSLRRVKDSSRTLETAAQMILQDPFTKRGREALIDGCRGILQGTSSLLLCFDASEVRKIVREVKKVLDYVAVAEVIENMDDLVQFVKDITPSLTKAAGLVDARQKELTWQRHREALLRSLNNVKQLAPILICAMKIYIHIMSQGGKGLEEAGENRTYLTQRMADELNEIIRVLQLTSIEDDEWATDDMTIMRRALAAIEGKMQTALDWLADPRALRGGLGERALRQILEQALKIADRCLPQDRDAIRKAVDGVSNMVDQLCELRAEGKGATPQAEALARGIQQRLGDLQGLLERAVANAERSGLSRPANTIAGRMAQAERWLNNPGVDDRGLGKSAINSITAEARKMAKMLPEPHRTDLLRLCDEADQLANELADLCRRGQGNTPEARALADKLRGKLGELKNRMQAAMMGRVVDDFADINTPLKQFVEAVHAPEGTPNREGNFHDKSRNLTEHALRACDTARMVANAGASNKHASDALTQAADNLEGLTPQLVNAGRIRMEYPANKAADEHFENLKKQFADSFEQMRDLVDDQLDGAALVKAIEEAMKRHTRLADDAMHQGNQQKLADNSSANARLANRVVHVAQREVDNSEDPSFRNKLGNAAGRVQQGITPMVQDAKDVVANIRDPNAQNQWKNSNKNLIDAVGKVREALTPAELPPLPPPPDLSQLNLGRKGPPPPVPPPYHQQQSDYEGDRPPSGGGRNFKAPPRPPPPQYDTDTDVDDDLFPSNGQDEPILEAARELHRIVKEWSSKDNEIIAAAKRMALLMAKLSQLVRGEGGNKKDLIDCAKAIAAASEDVTRAAKKLAKECTDKRMRVALLQVCERIPTIGTQLKILATVKATMLGVQAFAAPSPDGSQMQLGSEEDQEATEMLVGNAQNLMQSVRDVVRVAEAASIKMRTDSGYTLRWARKRPWYQQQ